MKKPHKTIHFIVNPFSGTTRKEKLPQLLDKYLDLDQYQYEIIYTEYAGHAITLTKEAVRQGIDVVVAVGGDGSVNEVAQSLVNSNSSLAILPGGSGNGFAMHLGLGRKMKHAISILNDSKIERIDTCLVNDRFFLNVSGIGFDARIAYKTKLNSKRGFLPYFMTSLKEANKFNPIKLTISLDGKEISGEYAAVVIANASMYGYHFTISPKASLQDGVMDLMLIKKAPLYKYFLDSFRFLNRSLHKSEITQTYAASKINITVPKEEYIHVDGEGYKINSNLKFRIVPQSLNVVVPKEKSITWEL